MLNLQTGLQASKKDQSKLFAAIPLSSSLPMGMRMMHDAYVFIYMMCTCIAALSKSLASQSMADISQAKVNAQPISNKFHLPNHVTAIHKYMPHRSGGYRVS